MGLGYTSMQHSNKNSKHTQNKQLLRAFAKCLTSPTEVDPYGIHYFIGAAILNENQKDASGATHTRALMNTQIFANCVAYAA